MDESFLLEQLVKSMDSMNSLNTSTDSASRLPPRKEDMNELLAHLEAQVSDNKMHLNSESLSIQVVLPIAQLARIAQLAQENGKVPELARAQLYETWR